MLTKFRENLFQPMNILPLVYVRVIFGAIMLLEVWRFFDNGWIKRYYIDPEVFFTYYGFDWVRPLPGDLMYMWFYALGALAICIMIGLGYRLAMPLFFFGFTYVFLLDQTNYLNHFYLISLLSLLMVFVPAHRAFSVDAWLNPEIRSRTAPSWALFMIRFQIGIAYFFGGIAKLNGDWLQGEPMRMWLASRTDFPVIGSLFTQEWMVYVFSYGGLFIDLLAVPLLLWKYTRPLAVVLLVSFHLLNARMFTIGIFPWFMLATLPLFFPVRWWDRLPLPTNTETTQPYRRHRLILGVIGAYCAFQILFPLRHFLYPGDVNWTEEGHQFSWHMKLRDKESTATFLVRDPATGDQWTVAPGDYLTRRQADKMPDSPDMILQYSHYLARRWREIGVENPEVYASVLTSLNGRNQRLLIDPSVNLATQSRNLLAADWILPLQDAPLQTAVVQAPDEADLE